jgi:nitrogen fixation protein NifU and related proteins
MNTADSFSSVLAREELLDHIQRPRNRGTLPQANVRAQETNPLCGDEVTVSALVEGGTIRNMMCDGHGCMISQAAGSLLTEDVVGKTPDGIFAMDRPDMERLLGGPVTPSRVKCLLLPLVALKKGIESHNHVVGS